MTEQTKPFYVEKLENMTIAAVKQVAKIWADAVRPGSRKRWNNGDGFQNAMVGLITSDVPGQLKAEHFDELERRIAECILATKPLNDYEEKYPDEVYKEGGSLSRWRSEIRVDYHPSNALRDALAQMGAEGPNGSIGRKIELLVPCKSDTEIVSCGIVERFGYGTRDTSNWNTFSEVSQDEYKVVNRYVDGNRYGGGWTADPDGTEELAWVTLAKGEIAPTVQVFKFRGYCHTARLFTTYGDGSGGCEGTFCYDASRVLGHGYLALVEKK
jgi:hypothetical protein